MTDRRAGARTLCNQHRRLLGPSRVRGQVTPADLVRNGLYKTLAVPLHRTNRHLAVAISQLARELGAQPGQKAKSLTSTSHTHAVSPLQAVRMTASRDGHLREKTDEIDVVVKSAVESGEGGKSGKRSSRLMKGLRGIGQLVDATRHGSPTKPSTLRKKSASTAGAAPAEEKHFSGILKVPASSIEAGDEEVGDEEEGGEGRGGRALR